jgi:hypothetical protein
MWVAPNTYNTLNKTLHKKWAIITDFREKAEQKNRGFGR